MLPRQPTLPLLWLLSDARNDDRLEAALASLPAGSGFVFRHYHLDEEVRRQRFAALKALAVLKYDHLMILAGSYEQARDWGATGVYGDTARIAPATDMLKLATAHDGDELAEAGRAGADGVFLSPVFPTRSHPELRPLGVHGFHVLAQQSPVPVIALGGMSEERASELNWPRWGAIDGLVPPQAA